MLTTPYLLLATAFTAALKAESYLMYVTRSVATATNHSSALASALSTSDEPLLTLEEIEPLLNANAQFLDAIASPHEHLTAPSSSAMVSVPLLVQLTRDWSKEGEQFRKRTYTPLLDSLLPFLAGRGGRAPAILVPGSGTGRFAYMIAERLPGATIVALDPDEHAQILAAHMLTGGKDTTEGISPPPAAARLPARLYPSLHVANNWERSAHRLASVDVPDVPLDTLHRVETSVNLTFAVGELDQNVLDWVVPQAFDAMATCFVLDVLRELPQTLKALHSLLAPSRGLWVNLGPLEFPQPTITLERPAEGFERAAALTAGQMGQLIRMAGFEMLEERMVEGCEYDGLPHQLHRVVRTCYFFVARPKEEAAEEEPGQAQRDEL